MSISDRRSPSRMDHLRPSAFLIQLERLAASVEAERGQKIARTKSGATQRYSPTSSNLRSANSAGSDPRDIARAMPRQKLQALVSRDFPTGDSACFSDTISSRRSSSMPGSMTARHCARTARHRRLRGFLVDARAEIRRTVGINCEAMRRSDALQRIERTIEGESGSFVVWAKGALAPCPP